MSPLGATEWWNRDDLGEIDRLKRNKLVRFAAFMLRVRHSSLWHSLNAQMRNEILVLAVLAVNEDSHELPFGLLRTPNAGIREHALKRFGALFRPALDDTPERIANIRGVTGVNLENCLVLCEEPQFLPPLEAIQGPAN